MNFKTTVILLVLLLGLGGYLFITRDKDATQKKSEVHKLVEIENASDVSKVTITDGDGKKTVLQKSGKGWRLVEPVNAEAETSDVNSMVDRLINMKSNDQLDPKDAIASKVGLDKPQFTVDLTAGDKTTQVQFGDKLAIGDGVYAKVGGKDVVEVVPADVLEKIDRPASAFRQLKLLNVSSADVKQLTLKTSDSTLRLVKNGADWSMNLPATAPAEASAVTDLLAQLTGLTASSFVPESAMVTEMMKSPALSVSFTTQAPTTQPHAATTEPAWTTVLFGDKDLQKKNVYVKVSDSPFVALVNASAFDALQKKPLDLRDKRVVDIKPEEVSRFSIASESAATTQPATRPAAHTEVIVTRRKSGTGVPFAAGSSVVIPKAAEKLTLDGIIKPASTWIIATAGDKAADESEVNALLAALHPLKVDKYIESPPIGPVVKQYTLTVSTQAAGGAPAVEHVIHLSDRGADLPYVGIADHLNFEISRTTLSRFLDGDYLPKPAGSTIQPPPPLPGGLGN